jgi:two-component system phosphate regulon sensor histidine kinase PhoR
VREELERFDPRESQEFALQVDITEQLTVWANGQALRQVLRNLLSNAFKYAPKQTCVGIKATLEEPSLSGSGSVQHVLISVSDTGPGIPPAEQSLLFEKFVRLNRDLSSLIPGSGLGLYISKQLVEAMEGHIWVESSGRAGEGSQFCFTLPGEAHASLSQNR